MKVAAFFISKSKQIYTETLTVSEGKFKLKVKSAWILYEILVTSAVTCKQSLLHKNEIQNY